MVIGPVAVRNTNAWYDVTFDEYDLKLPKEEEKWYAGKQYDDDMTSAKDALETIATWYPGYEEQGYEIAGFAWWQGHEDAGSST